MKHTRLRLRAWSKGQYMTRASLGGMFERALAVSRSAYAIRPRPQRS